jgi:excisionase family DNA binding protein
MNTIDDKPLFTLTVGEYNEMIRELLAGLKQVEQVTSVQNDPDIVMTLEHACKFLNIARPTMYGMTSRRTIPFMKRGKKVYFRKDDLIEWLNKGRRKTVEELTNESIASLKKRKNKYD